MKLASLAIAATVALPAFALGASVLSPDGIARSGTMPKPAVAAAGEVPSPTVKPRRARSGSAYRLNAAADTEKPVATELSVRQKWRHRSSPPGELYFRPVSQ